MTDEIILKIKSCKECPYHRTIKMNYTCNKCGYDGYETCSYRGNHPISDKIDSFPKKGIPNRCPLRMTDEKKCKTCFYRGLTHWCKSCIRFELWKKVKKNEL